MSELTAALATIEKCREITNCPVGVDLQDHLTAMYNDPLIPGCDGAKLMPSTGEVIKLNPATNKLYTPLSTGILITREMIIAGQAELESCIDRGFDSDTNGNSHYYMTIASDAPSRVFCAMLNRGDK